MALLLQLNGELPDRFPGHDRRLYIWACRRKACWRKPGSIRATRATRATKPASPHQAPQQQEAKESIQPAQAVQTSKPDLGAALFGAKVPASAGRNPFASGNPFSTGSASTSTSVNPFSTAPAPISSLTAKPGQTPVATGQDEGLAHTFAEKARLDGSAASSSFANTISPKLSTAPHVTWPTKPSDLAQPFPKYYLDADYECLAPEEPKAKSAHHAAFMDVDSGEGSSAKESKEDKLLYEDVIDKTFQRFADMLAQNPEQVLRYEFGGAPLLYSRTDAVGVQLLGPPHKGAAASAGRGGMPRCEHCGAERVFEVQLTPQAIVELEEDETGLGEGMEWGTIVMGVCSKDCVGAGEDDGEKVVYREEWAGVQWEEVVERRRQ